jgi:hypothetical protein
MEPLERVSRQCLNHCRTFEAVSLNGH